MLEYVPTGTVKLSADEIKVGHACVSEFDEMWFRAEIESVDGENVKIRYIDYGS